MKKLIALIFGFALIFNLLPPAFAAEPASSKEQRFSVLFNENRIPENFQNQLKSAGGEIIYSVPEIGFVQVKAPSGSMKKIMGISDVQAVNPSISWNIPQQQRIKEKAVNPEKAALWNKQWDIQRITQNGESYKLGTGSHQVVVGIIDTGIDRDHPDLVKNLLPGSKNFVPAGGYLGTEPYESGNPDAFDDIHGHGSHVAGSIAGNGAMLGVAPDAGIRAYRVIGGSSAESAWIFAAIIAAANDGSDIISMSIGGYDIIGQVFYTDPETGKKINLGNDVADFTAYKRAVQYAAKKGSLIVAAAGNEGLNAGNKREVMNYLNAAYAENGLSFVGAGFQVPGTLPGVVTVAATGQHDVLADYSNYGPGFIDIAAVGGDLRLYNQYAAEGRLEEYMDKRLYEQEFNLSTGPGGSYFWSAGTSMATPKVSAVAALLIDKYGKMPPHKLESLLYKEAVDPVKGEGRKYFGNGHLNAYKALK
jgi:subtilisin family serine protease